MLNEEYQFLIRLHELAEKHDGQRLPAMSPARLARAYCKLLAYPKNVPRNEAQWVQFEIDAGIRSGNRGLRAFLRAFHMWKHGSGSTEWNDRHRARRAKLYRFARANGMADDRYN